MRFVACMTLRPFSAILQRTHLHTSSYNMSPVRVGVIGGGIAGPVAAMFLKQKGYEPTIYERTESPSDAGLGIGSVLAFPIFVRC